MTPSQVNIQSAEHVGDYRINLVFDDGTEQTVDFLPFLSHSRHPDIRNYLNPKRFASFHVEYGDLVWGEYELCFPIMDLYRNQMLHAAPLEAVA